MRPERHALFLAVDVEDEDRDILADLQHFAGVVQAAPRHVRDVQQTVDAVEVDERTEVGEVLDRALDGLAGLDRLEEGLALFGALLLDQFAAAEHHVLAVVVELDDFEVVRVADVGVEILGLDDVHLRAGQECLDADVDRAGRL